MKELTNKQEQFCYNIAVNKMSQIDAYLAVYNSNTSRRNTPERNASVLRHSKKIAQRINELLDKQYEPEILSVIHRKKILSDIATEKIYNDKGTLLQTPRIQAISELNDMENVGKQTSQGVTVNIDKAIIDARGKLLNRLSINSGTD